LVDFEEGPEFGSGACGGGGESPAGDGLRFSGTVMDLVEFTLDILHHSFVVIS